MYALIKLLKPFAMEMTVLCIFFVIDEDEFYELVILSPANSTCVRVSLCFFGWFNERLLNYICISTFGSKQK